MTRDLTSQGKAMYLIRRAIEADYLEHFFIRGEESSGGITAGDDIEVAKELLRAKVVTLQEKLALSANSPIDTDEEFDQVKRYESVLEQKISALELELNLLWAQR